jgi:hypothetical protein
MNGEIEVIVGITAQVDAIEVVDDVSLKFSRVFGEYAKDLVLHPHAMHCHQSVWPYATSYVSFEELTQRPSDDFSRSRYDINAV